MRSLSFKLIISFLVVSLVGTLLVTLLVRQATADEFGQFVFDRELESIASQAADYYQTHGSWDGAEWSRWQSNRMMMPGGAMPGAGRGMGQGGMVALADVNGVVVLSGAGHRLGERLSRAEISQGKAIEYDGQIVGIVFARPIPFRPSLAEEAFLAGVNRILILATVIATGVALVLGVLIARALTQPLRELTSATRAVAAGDLAQQVAVRSQDELGELAHSFNQMSADLVRSRDARRQMTADIAHELRTPLSIILGHAEALHDGVLPPSQETFYIIHDEAQRLNRQIDDLRTLTLADAGELSLTRRLSSPGAMLERAAAAHAPQAAQKGISLELDVAPDLPEIDVDPDRMAQVISNLLDNALRYTPSGQQVRLSAVKVEKAVRLVIQDSGPGIAAEQLARVFDRFYRADRSRRRDEGGSGLGLAIAKSLVLRHQGRIWAESQPGQGSTFTVELPMSGS